MSIPDLINGGYEALGGIFVLNHCRVLMKQRNVAGVSIVSTIFFLSWGCWNLFYYPTLHQWVSFAGGLALVLANLLYISLLIRYSKPVIEFGGKAGESIS